MPQGILQFRASSSPGERERKLNDIARLFDNRLKKLENNLIEDDFDSRLSSLEQSVGNIVKSITTTIPTPLALLINGTRSMAANLNMDANDLLLDVDGDTYLHSSGDDIAEFVLATAAGQLDININGVDDFRFAANLFTGLPGSSMLMDTITIASGSIVDSTGTIDFDNENLITTGIITGNSFITASDIGIAGDTDLIQLTADTMLVNGSLQSTSIGCGIAPDATTIGKFYRDDTSTTTMVKIEQDGAGDAPLTFSLTGGAEFTIGAENTWDYFILQPGSALNSSGYFNMNTTGEIGIGRGPVANTLLYLRKDATDSHGTGATFFTRAYSNNSGNYQNVALNAIAYQYGNNNNTGRLVGFLMAGLHFGTGTLDDLQALSFSYGNSTGSGNTTNVYGMELQPYQISGVITNSYDIFVRTPVSGTGTATNEWGIYFEHDATWRMISDFQIDADSKYILFGASQDAGDTFDGTDLIRDYDLLGSGVTDYRIQENGVDVLTIIAGGTTNIGDGGATNYSTFGPDGTLEFNGTARIDWTKKIAASVTITVGGTDATSVVANLQSSNDGNVFHLDEVSASPAIDMYVEFTSVTAFNWVKVLAQYDGISSHDLTIQIYNWSSTSWETYSGLPSMNYDTTPNPTFCNGDFFVPDDSDYIGTGGDSGKVRVKLIHFTNGNASHDLYIDVVALYQ